MTSTSDQRLGRELTTYLIILCSTLGLESTAKVVQFHQLALNRRVSSCKVLPQSSACVGHILHLVGVSNFSPPNVREST